MANPNKPLQKSKWVAAVDTVGGEPLVGIMRQLKVGGCVTACGMVAGDQFTSSIFPFILRGVALYGIDSAWAQPPKRRELWQQLAGPWKPSNLEQVVNVVGLDEVGGKVEEMLAGNHIGRTIIEL